jgi:hypothetical protein
LRVELQQVANGGEAAPPSFRGPPRATCWFLSLLGPEPGRGSGPRRLDLGWLRPSPPRGQHHRLRLGGHGAAQIHQAARMLCMAACTAPLGATGGASTPAPRSARRRPIPPSPTRRRASSGARRSTSTPCSEARASARATLQRRTRPPAPSAIKAARTTARSRAGPNGPPHAL